MVLQKRGGAPLFCLGPFAASLPPQCGGPVLRNWDWSEAGHFASAGGVMWGSYEVTGMLANGEFIQTRRPVPSTDASPPEARPVTGPPGNGKEMQLLLLQRELTSLRGQPILMSGAENGYLVIDVVYDDGSLQRVVPAGVVAPVNVVRHRSDRCLALGSAGRGDESVSKPTAVVHC
ncbi:hypothetical protein ARGLB_020_00230 [Arthrobacter globiformis NBRC 12137]|uniref:Uncharacterized protein n=1 Tax=Arthrobacter globiformis (strain ATCC 8010 / DSM 20124 / JCM 1332 / NBRC 12137 / NCIMB 8907 / NRRL B-2979 / 168) TaxID=1077972 RepID=H0QIF2_ARTG1|nr:hypothetical protein ARGLB_020_00230 [Arthrobacter globiformis NBRC 12137]